MSSSDGAEEEGYNECVYTKNYKGYPMTYGAPANNNSQVRRNRELSKDKTLPETRDLNAETNLDTYVKSAQYGDGYKETDPEYSFNKPTSEVKTSATERTSISFDVYNTPEQGYYDYTGSYRSNQPRNKAGRKSGPCRLILLLVAMSVILAASLVTKFYLLYEIVDLKERMSEYEESSTKEEYQSGTATPSDLKAFQEKISALEAELESVKAAHRKDIESLSDDVGILSMSSLTINTDVETVKSSLIDMQEVTTQMEATLNDVIYHLNSTLSELKMEELKHNTTKLSESAEDLRSNLEELKNATINELDLVNNKVDDLDTLEMKAFDDRLQAVEADQDGIKDRVTQVESDTSENAGRVEEVNTDLTERMESIEDDTEDLRTDLSSLIGSVNGFGTRVARLETEVDIVEAQLNSKADEDEVDDLKNKVGSLACHKHLEDGPIVITQTSCYEVFK